MKYTIGCLLQVWRKLLKAVLHSVSFFSLLTVFYAILFVAVQVSAQQISSKLYDSMRWRMIGPHRGGRTVAATGIPEQPNVFYIGVCNGGVWKTTDYGRVWKPIFDDQSSGSIGAIAVAPSNPNIIYVGSGEGLRRPDLSVGNGFYKSTDGGKTWRRLGLQDGQQIGAIIVDPYNPNIVLVAVLGHPYGPNAERGVFRSTDGGETFQKVLYKDENTGAITLAFDPADSRIVFTALWESRQGPWENASWQGPGSGLYKSTDGGVTWRQLTQGLPTFEQGGLGRIGFAIAPSNSKKMYALVDARQNGGLYRSQDAGESWELINTDGRIWGRGDDFAEVDVDPKNENIVYSANIAMYKSIDGGLNFTCIKGAPGGDDYHTIWINPDNPNIILTASDQGAVITVNGGETWSSWYNQPTAQFYHVITDNQFPYWVYGGQQESGSVGISSRGNDGQITFREWHPVGADEYAYIAPDPLNPNIVYGGKVTKYDKTTGIGKNVAPRVLRSGGFRTLRTAPLVFSPVDPHILFFAANVLFKTADGGENWDIISPDLSREKPEIPKSVGVYSSSQSAQPSRRGVIYAVAPSYIDVNIIWAGTDDGLIHITRDGGKSWQNVTPPEITSWNKVSIIDAGRFDKETAYAAVNCIRCDDMHPYIFRTHDGGKSWKKIVAGLPDFGPVNTVREDPQRKGLLFAGTEQEVFVSFNDGENWLPLRLNMPATSIRDLVVHNDDIVVGTHGRSFWILDDITPLRQITEQTAASEAYLYKPQTAYLLPRNTNTDTPLPPEEPAGKNPPDGAIINYYLKSDVPFAITLEIFDSKNTLVRRFPIFDQPVFTDEEIRAMSASDLAALLQKYSGIQVLTSTGIESRLALPDYWIRPPQILSAEAGSHRFVWDLRLAPAAVGRRSYPISAIYQDTPSSPLGAEVQPGEYTVKLTVSGRSYTQPLTVKPDPRVK